MKIHTQEADNGWIITCYSDNGHRLGMVTIATNTKDALEQIGVFMRDFSEWDHPDEGRGGE